MLLKFGSLPIPVEFNGSSLIAEKSQENASCWYDAGDNLACLHSIDFSKV